jgi:hypothetical protein
MWQIIVRMSLDRDRGSRVRNALVPILRRAGLHRRAGRTGTWESLVVPDMSAAAEELRRLLRILANPVGRVYHASPHVRLDHLWIYIAKVRVRRRIIVDPD